MEEIVSILTSYHKKIIWIFLAVMYMYCIIWQTDLYDTRFNLEAKTIKGYHRIEEGNLYHVRNIELTGSCCLAIYNNYNFRGLKHTMMPGFNIVPKFVKILSFKFGYCNGVSWFNNIEKYDFSFLLPKKHIVHTSI